jgi:hypothetical protein
MNFKVLARFLQTIVQGLLPPPRFYEFQSFGAFFCKRLFRGCCHRRGFMNFKVLARFLQTIVQGLLPPRWFYEIWRVFADFLPRLHKKFT